ncbi:MAG: P-loop NTPase [Acidimicrobiia bacterium]|nr:P-loop NTPase [Acidimicrobiia bacterium]
MRLGELLRTVRRHWKVALATLAVFVLAGSAAAFLPANRYTATATLFVQPEPDAAASSNAVQAVEFLLPGLAQQVESSTFIDTAYEKTGVAADVGNDVTAEAEPGSGILRIDVESTSRDFVAPAADALAAELIETNPSADLAEITVLERAKVPTEPSAPVRIPILLGSLVLGLIAALFAALGADGLRRRLGAADEIHERLGAEVLGVIPSYRRTKRAPATSAELFGNDDHPAAVEAFYRLATNIELALVSKNVQVLLVTSSSVGAGKTTVAANLAWALAAVGHEVTVIDADLRRPELHQLLDRPRHPGVASLGPGIQPNEMDEVVVPAGQPSLRFVPAGYSSRHPAGIVRAALEPLLDELRTSSGLVVIDSAPLNGAAETSLIAALAGTALLVVDPRKESPDDVERSLAQLHQAGADVLGVVVNRVSLKRFQRTAEKYYFAPQNRRRAPSSTTSAATKGEQGTREARQASTKKRTGRRAGESGVREPR